MCFEEKKTFGTGFKVPSGCQDATPDTTRKCSDRIRVILEGGSR